MADCLIIMGFDGAVSGSHYLFGENVSLIEFIKAHVFPPSSGWQLNTAHRLVPLINYVSLLNGLQHLQV